MASESPASVLALSFRVNMDIYCRAEYEKLEAMEREKAREEERLEREERRKKVCACVFVCVCVCVCVYNVCATRSLARSLSAG